MATFTTYYNLTKPAVNSPVDEDLWGDELNDNMDIIDQTLHDLSLAGGMGVPSGTVCDFAGATAPTGWLLCYGQLVSRTTYADLFTAIGTTYGAGDGSTTFGLPDMRGRVGVGKDNMGGTAASRVTTAGSGVDGLTLGAVGGSQNHTLTTAQLASHSHTGTTDSSGLHTHTSNTDSRSADSAGTTCLKTASTPTGTFNITIDSSGAHTHAFTTATAGSGDAHNNMQPTIIFNKIIKT
jgi:microcystin-dependent protein